MKIFCYCFLARNSAQFFIKFSINDKFNLDLNLIFIFCLQKGYEIRGFDSVNIYPLMCYLLGLNSAPNNGSLEILMETLADNTTWINYTNIPGLVIVFLVTLLCFNAVRRISH